ncbi:Oidioi.mRNA.OKI2018_I69.chr2.g5212.t1.cds [Oikopleura dioica]|uniref:Oidioi.mRNA.OKI2018_I69.chr2.g5212.t1.cds n=1 Tax=Oikopleura dioica TaxID=34765 RepID=A0ABN7T407_OIKDI|nr:Oidioi.mRNA.OKI2018_I69.chr2.g5212.t1.cds [Oikopleura dioica]
MCIRFRLKKEIQRLNSSSVRINSNELRLMQKTIFEECERDALLQLKQGSFYRFRDSLKKSPRGTFNTNTSELIIQPIDSHAHKMFL